MSKTVKLKNRNQKEENDQEQQVIESMNIMSSLG